MGIQVHFTISMYLVHPKRLKASPVATYLSHHFFMSWKRSHFQLLHILVPHSFLSITTYDMHPPTDYTKYAAPGYPSAPMSIPPAQLYPPFAVHVPTPNPNTSGKWSTSLCHCFDDPVNCLVTCICPCVTFGQIAEIISQGENSCLASGGIYGVLLGVTGLACLYSCFYRSRMRGQYELEEAPCDDCVLHLCCETCALCQEYRELKNRGFDMGIGWEANMNRQQGRATTVAPFQGTMRR